MDSNTLLDSDVSTLSTDGLIAAITELAAHMNAAEHRLITLIGEWDRRDMPNTGGTCTIVQWLGWQCGINSGAARQKVRVARALRELPAIRACFAKGEVSYSKVRAITRVATPANEQLLLGYARSATAAQIESIVRGYRRLQTLADPDVALRQYRDRGLHMHFDEDGMLVLQGRFPPEEGALILKAIEGVQERLYAAAQADDETSHSARRADALVQLVEQGLSSDAAPAKGDRHLVVVHVAADGQAELEDGPALATPTVRRIACDASNQLVSENKHGHTVSIGRRSRTVPYWLRRTLKHRDGGCRFPGCTHQQHVDAHHIQHWADGGETSLDNLVLLCRRHHRAVHDQGYQCTAHKDGRITFAEPDGITLPNVVPQRPGSPKTLLDQHPHLAIDEHTCAGGWDGWPVDISEAVGHLWTLDVSAETSGSKSSAGPLGH